MTHGPEARLGARIGNDVRRTTGRVRRWWRSAPTPARAFGVVIGVCGAALLGAFLFGAWHVLFGWLIRGNWRAGLFGLGLAAVAGLLLALGGALVRRRLLR